MSRKMRALLIATNVLCGLTIVWTAWSAVGNWRDAHWLLLAVNLGVTIPLCSLAIWMNRRTLRKYPVAQ